MNDKNKADHGKEPISLVPTQIIWEIAKVRDYGVNVKYPGTGRDGWREIGIERIRDAMLRHCLRYIKEPYGVDEESGLPHLSHLATNIAFLCELEIKDDKPFKNLPSAKLDRDIPIKPIETTDKAWGIPHKQAVCPKCNYYLGHVSFLGDYKGKRITYCETCGQAIDWEGWDSDDN